MEDSEETSSGLVIELARARQRIDDLGRREAGRGAGKKGLKLPGQAFHEGAHTVTPAKGGSNDGVAIVKEKTLLYVNDRFLEIFGYRSTEEVVGSPVAIIAHPDDQEKILEFLDADEEGERSNAVRVQRGAEGQDDHSRGGLRAQYGFRRRIRLAHLFPGYHGGEADGGDP